jgi:hypothetical protein
MSSIYHYLPIIGCVREVFTPELVKDMWFIDNVRFAENGNVATVRQASLAADEAIKADLQFTLTSLSQSGNNVFLQPPIEAIQQAFNEYKKDACYNNTEETKNHLQIIKKRCVSYLIGTMLSCITLIITALATATLNLPIFLLWLELGFSCFPAYKRFSLYYACEELLQKETLLSTN